MMKPQIRSLLLICFLFILLIVVGISVWLLIDTLALNQVATSGNFFITYSFILKIGFCLISVLLLAVIIKMVAGLFGAKSDRHTILTLVENTSSDPSEIQTTIIRLRQILDPEQMKLAASIAYLLDHLLKALKEFETDKETQLQQQSEINQAVHSLQDENEQLSHAPNLRSEFLSRMGDEITQPMNSLGTMLKLLKSMEFSDEARDLITIASHSAHSLIENLTNILEFSKLDANLFELNADFFDLTEAVTLILDTQESIALSKSLMIETHINPDVPELVRADQHAIDKILSNLVSNAIRFTDRGHIKLVVDQQQQDGRKMLRFTVIDTGIGIPESAIGSLFDSLDKDTELVNSSFTGRLRLIVSKKLCELMGGAIGVRSKEGEGSQFWFTVDITQK